MSNTQFCRQKCFSLKFQFQIVPGLHCENSDSDWVPRICLQKSESQSSLKPAGKNKSICLWWLMGGFWFCSFVKWICLIFRQNLKQWFYKRCEKLLHPENNIVIQSVNILKINVRNYPPSLFCNRFMFPHFCSDERPLEDTWRKLASKLPSNFWWVKKASKVLYSSSLFSILRSKTILWSVWRLIKVSMKKTFLTTFHGHTQN